MASKKRAASDIDYESERANKKQKMAATTDKDPALTDLPDDPLLHLLNFVGAQGLLTLASSCSKFKTLVDSSLQSLMKKIFPVGFDGLNRAASVLELKRAAKIEQTFGYRVKIMAITPGADEPPLMHIRGQLFRSSPLQLLKWDEFKLARLSRDRRKCVVVCTQTGRNLCAINFDFTVAHFASSSMSQMVFAGTNDEGADRVLVYAFDNQYAPSQIGSFTRNGLNHGQLCDVAWTASNDLVLIRSTSYELCSVSGQSLRNKLFEVNEEGAMRMAVSPDGTFAIRAEYEFSGEPAFFYKVNIEAGTEKRVFKIDDVADFMEHLRFVGNNPDLLTWYIEGTGQSAIFLRNLKTNKQKMWPVNTGVNDISLDGTKVVTRLYNGEHEGQSQIFDVSTNKLRGQALTQDERQMQGFALQYYNWTYPNVAHGPSEKLFSSGSDRVQVFDPQTGAHLAELKFFSEDMFMRLVALSSDNRTLVFGGDICAGRTDAATAVVWHFY